MNDLMTKDLSDIRDPLRMIQALRAEVDRIRREHAKALEEIERLEQLLSGKTNNKLRDAAT